jgi:type IV pilus assembly protein PilA
VDETQTERWRSAIGPNADDYLRRFKRIGDAGGWAPSWNMAAFLHSTGWFCYRRMFDWAGLNLLAPFVLLIAMLLVAFVTPHSNLDSLAGILVLLYLVVVFVLLPVLADSIYYRRLRARLADPQAKVRTPSSFTMLGAFGTGALWLCIVYIAVAPMYGGYTPRAKVSEAILTASTTRTDVTNFFENERRLPRADEAERFRADQPSRYVERLVYEPQEKRIVITLREIQPGKRIAFYASEEDGKLTWTCRAIDVESKYLPSPCRP